MCIGSTAATLQICPGTTHSVIARWVWLVMMIGIGIEFALGVARCARAGRTTGSMAPSPEPGPVRHPRSSRGPAGDRGVGNPLAVLDGPKPGRLGAQIGLFGLLLGAGGGMLSVSASPWRLTGMGLMFAGALVAFFGYLIPLAESRCTILEPHQGDDHSTAPVRKMRAFVVAAPSPIERHSSGSRISALDRRPW